MLDPWCQIVESNVAELVASVRRIVGNDHDAEDVVQEVFVEAFRLSHTKKIENWPALLRRMAQRRAIDQLRRAIRQKSATSSDAINDVPTIEADPSEVFAAGELQHQLRIAIAKLPDREAAVFSLAYFDGLSRGEIATVLQTTANAVSVALHKAIQRLRPLLKQTIGINEK